MSQPPLPPPIPPPTPPPPPPIQTPPPYLPPSPLSGTPQSESEVSGAEQKALIGFILGICQFPLMLFCSFAMVACAIPALVLGHQAHLVLRRPEVDSGRTGLALAAKVLGIIGTVLGGLILLGTAAVWIWMFTRMQSMPGGPGGGGTTP